MMERLRGRGIDLYLVRVFGNVRDVLTRSGFLDELGPEHVWHSIAAGVKAARAAPPLAVVLPDGVLPGAVDVTDLDEDADLDEPENGAHGEHIASKPCQTRSRAPDLRGSRRRRPACRSCCCRPGHRCR